MRFFIALEIPEASKQELEDVQKQIQDLIFDVRLTDPNKLHLTIAFIGEQPDELTDDLTQIMTKAVERIPAFFVTPAYLDGFPSLHHPNVIWTGVKGDIDKLMIIRERVKDGLVKLNFDVDERRYTPHITLAKTNGNFKLTPEQEAKFQSLMLSEFEPIEITSIKLFDSIPEEGFHKHNTLSEISLAKS